MRHDTDFDPEWWGGGTGKRDTASWWESMASFLERTSYRIEEQAMFALFLNPSHNFYSLPKNAFRIL